MGVHLHYQAMPEGSRLFARLRAERPLCVMYAGVIHSPAGPYDTDGLDPHELDDLLGDLAGNPAFGSWGAVDRAYADFRGELVRAADEFPGLRERSAYFKLVEVDERLAGVLARAGCPDARALADALVWGAEPFAPDGWGTGDVTLQLVPAALVARGADWLGRVPTPRPDQCAGDFDALRAVYAAAATRGEAIVIA